ncbi:hypothetical protein F9K33_16415 [bacterium]|nr:MAG: hypothetical protein F9K33_16415 [bacterium]
MTWSKEDLKIPRTPDRPGFLMFLAVINIIGGVFFIGFDIFWGWSIGKMASDVIGVHPIEIVLNILFLGVLSISSGIGILKATEWGWHHALYYYVYAIMRYITAISYLDDWPSEAFAKHSIEYQYVKFSVRIIISILLIWYLFSPRVLQYFRLEGMVKKPVLKKIGIFVGCVFAIEIITQLFTQ